jgi:sugar phosphate permease
MGKFKTFRWILFGTIGSLYFFAMLHRLAPTVIARDLAAAFDAEAVMLGIISSTYFYFYSAAQPVVGYLSDTVGPRKILTASFIIAGIGTVIFALAPNAATAMAGRALIGFGAGGVFIPGLKVFSHWYRVDEFSVMTGLLLTIGGLGGLSAAVPLTYAVVAFGWRIAFMGIGVLSIILAGACWIVTRDKPEDRGWPPVPDTTASIPSVQQERLSVGRRMILIFGNFNFWMISLNFFFTGGVFLTFQGLWAVPYLMDVFHIERVAAGSVLMCIPLGFATGGPCLSLLARRFGWNQKKIILWAMVVSLVAWIVLLFLQQRSHLFIVAPLFFLLGVVGGGTAPMLLALNRELFPPALMGTASGLTNMATFVGTALFQPLTGLMLQQFPVLRPGVYSFEAYRCLLVFFIVCFAAALIVTALLAYRKSSRPSPPNR